MILISQLPITRILFPKLSKKLIKKMMMIKTVRGKRIINNNKLIIMNSNNTLLMINNKLTIKIYNKHIKIKKKKSQDISMMIKNSCQIFLLRMNKDLIIKLMKH